MKFLRFTLPIAIVSLSTLSFAQYTYTDDGVTSGAITGHFDGSVDIYFAPGLGDINGGPQFVAYCVDLADSTSQGNSWAVDPIYATSSGSTYAGKIAQVYNAFASTASASSEGEASLQLAIWSVLVDGGSQINSAGGPSVTLDNSSYSGVITQANTWLADTSAINAASTSATWIKALSHPSNTNQDFITSTSNVAPTPEPCSLLALATGVGIVIRKRAKQAKA